MEKLGCYITNISKIIITIPDLDLILYPLRTLNIAAKKYNISNDEIQKSLESGDLKKKKKYLIVSNRLPKITQNPQLEMAKCSPATVRIKYQPEESAPSLLDLFDNASDQKYIDEMLDAEDEK